MSDMDPVTEKLVQHMEYCRLRDKAATKALELLLEPGRREEAMDLADEAEMWDLKAKALEPTSGITERIVQGKDHSL